MTSTGSLVPACLFTASSFTLMKGLIWNTSAIVEGTVGSPLARFSWESVQCRGIGGGERGWRREIKVIRNEMKHRAHVCPWKESAWIAQWRWKVKSKLLYLCPLYFVLYGGVTWFNIFSILQTALQVLMPTINLLQGVKGGERGNFFTAAHTTCNYNGIPFPEGVSLISR